MKQEVTGAICLALAGSIWGGVYVVSKYILEFVTPMTLLWIRYAIAFALLYAVLSYHKKKDPAPAYHREKDLAPAGIKRNWKLLVWIGFIGYFGSVYLQFIGTKMADAHTGALISSATPAFVVLFAKFVLGERITRRKIMSLIVATAGVIIVVGWTPQSGTYFAGTMVLIGAAVAWALLSVYVKLASLVYSSLEITTYAILTALILATPFMVLEVGTNPIQFGDPLMIPGILYTSVIATAGAFYLWNKGLEYLNAGAGSLFLFLQPIVGGYLGWLLLGEKLTANFFIGGLMIAVGVIIVTVKDRSMTCTNFPSHNK